ncbi:lysozyme [Gilliamella sp. Pas-s25]|uniref:lysozyme n=1 Tax=Gilliamella sp. Pas-s25 TaxID=2687310 RepID=UPI00135DC028|nr:lysozyme [Gilliamella sp. Pas-s25]MWP61063.1 glycoside hydrolase family protein [Gilliamella sp. Pas-s25]
MKISINGKSKLKSFEGLRLIAYQCSAGVWTIGWGHTTGVKEGDKITIGQAEIFLTGDLVQFENAVNKLVKVPINQNQFDALILLIFNIGITAFTGSTLLRKLNAGDYSGASNQFLVWNKIRVNGVKKPSLGLTQRRQAEKELFDRA